MRERFGLGQERAERLLLPAFADWRDAVGCADPLLVPANAQGPAAEKALVPLPVPSWCAWLADAGVLRFDGPPSIQGPRVVQPAWLLVVREAELGRRYVDKLVRVWTTAGVESWVLGMEGAEDGFDVAGAFGDQGVDAGF